ncbi:hypothetical protein TAMA11512_24400 [Selenomonas sp. TAMA-11512]|uniref:DUF1659 domain-containing protein n=1 Tax=Selenomonas sp. TAMA-11512 TaxID=3095337 RepID=UPI00308FCE23|nr:hypothetical protein TAMA11512_24400 [Selenomonas sp. TAMA-11512]
MAVKKTEAATKLIVRVESGTKPNGTPNYKDRSFANVRQALTDAEVYSLGAKLGALQELPVRGVKRQDASTLVDE